MPANERLVRLVHSRGGTYFTIAVILINAILVGFEVSYGGELV